MYKQIDSNKRLTVWLFLSFCFIVMGVGWALSYYFNDVSILVIAVVIAVVQSWVSYYYSDKLALAVTGAKEASREQYLELHRLVENIAITAGLPKPRVYVINDPSPNAFATGRNPQHAAVAVTTGLLQTLDKSELEGVVAHEMAHIGNYDILVMTIAVTLVGVITLIADIFTRSLWFKDSNDNKNNGYMVIVGLILVILAPIFAKLIQLAISRKREYMADATGALLTRYPEGLAKALEKIEAYEQPMKRANRATAHLYINEPFGVDDRKQSWLTTIYSTHPPIHDRVTRLREML